MALPFGSTNQARIHSSRRSPTARSALAAFGLIAICASAGSATAQTSYSQAFIYNGNSNATTCDNREPMTSGGSSAGCVTPTSPEASASAVTSSDNATRTVSSTAALTQQSSDNSFYSNSQAISYQNSAVGVTGAPAPSDYVVFHFATPVFGGTAEGGGSGPAAYWQLFFYDGTYGYSNAYTQLNGDGSGTTTTNGNAQFTPEGVDVTAQLTAFNNPNTLNFIFGSYATATDGCGGLCSTQLTSSVTATLSGVDMFEANGQKVSSATFNADGTGLIDLTTTTPEPSSVALLGTGIFGLAPFVRKRRRRSR